MMTTMLGRSAAWHQATNATMQIEQKMMDRIMTYFVVSFVFQSVKARMLLVRDMHKVRTANDTCLISEPTLQGCRALW